MIDANSNIFLKVVVTTSLSKWGATIGNLFEMTFCDRKHGFSTIFTYLRMLFDCRTNHLRLLARGFCQECAHSVCIAIFERQSHGVRIKKLRTVLYIRPPMCHGRITDVRVSCESHLMIFQENDISGT